MAPLRFCTGSPTCSNKVTSGLCPEHSRQHEHNRGNYTTRRWYRVARWCHPVWGLRAQALQRYPLCVDCLELHRTELSTDVDHQIPHRGDPVLFWDLTNLRGRCHPHHSAKTARGE